MMAIFQHFNELPLEKKKKKRNLKPINLSDLIKGKKNQKKNNTKKAGGVLVGGNVRSQLCTLSRTELLQTAENLGGNQAQSSLSGELPCCTADILQT